APNVTSVKRGIIKFVHLFYGRRNNGGQANYTCPSCFIEEVERGDHVPLPQSAVLGAKDLPRTILSDHMGQRLFAKLKQERQDTTRLQSKSYGAWSISNCTKSGVISGQEVG
ncbi:UNVERIFIED_CONTAM: Histone acetyltransferase HAC1, partial [Sesamum indicum]